MPDLKSIGRFASIPLLVCLLLLTAACTGPVIDPADPLEQKGDSWVRERQVLIPNPEDGTAPLSGTLYAPFPSSGARIPLLLMLPGFGASEQAYAEYARHLASHGFLVLGVDYVGNPLSLDGRHDYKARQVLYALDYMLQQSRWAGEIDPARVGVLGHSLGGKLAFYAAALDARIGLVMALDPVNAGGAPCTVSPEWCAAYPVAPNPARGQTGLLGQIDAASLIFRSEPDGLLNPEAEFNAFFFFFGSDGAGADAVGPPALYVDMGEVAHGAYLPAFGGITPQVVKRTLLAWVMRHFRGADVDSYLTGERMEADIAAGRVAGAVARE
jgi:pimeloyl-ACP methyl ester carboxylesterase